MNSTTNEPSGTVQGDIPRWLLPVREFIFGKQNERIEYFMDSYFKLPPEGRTAVVSGAFILGGLILFGFIAAYLTALSSLQTKLDNSFLALNKLRTKQVEYAVTKRKFDELDKRLANVSSSVQILSFLEEKAKANDLQISGNSKADKASGEKDFIRSTPLEEKYKSTRSEFRVSNVSLKKIIDLVVSIESDDKMLRVTDLRIKGLYQNKLFFDATFGVDGIEAKK